MAKQRMINTRFWDDEFIGELDPEHKLLFLYLLTNTNTEMCGAYQLSIKRIAFDTGLDRSIIVAGLGKFAESGKVEYIDGWVILRNFAKHQINNPRVARGAARSLNECPEWVQVKVRSTLNTPLTLSVPVRVQVPDTVRREVIKRDSESCVICNSTNDLTIDHIRPVAIGGGNEIENLRTLCRSCNGKRNAELRWNPDGSITHPLGEGAPITPTPQPQPKPKPKPKPKPIGEETPQAASPPPKPARGTRISDPFLLTSEMRAYGLDRRPDVDLEVETEKFVNYWRAKTGKDATKLDWQATWRNWILNARAGWTHNGATNSNNSKNKSLGDSAEQVSRLADNITIV